MQFFFLEQQQESHGTSISLHILSEDLLIPCAITVNLE